MSSNKENLKTIILTAIITTILTVLTQYFLQKNQLANEQDYWKKRFNIENANNINNLRIKYIEEISSSIYQLEIQVKEIKILKDIVEYSKSDEDYKKLNKLLVQYHKDLYALASKMEMASLYFDEDVKSELDKLGKAVTKNFQQKNGELENDTKIIKTDLRFESIEDLRNAKKNTFDLMLQKIHKDMNEQFSN